MHCETWEAYVTALVRYVHLMVLHVSVCTVLNVAAY